MPIFATAGSKIYIGQALAPQTDDFVESDFDTQSWVEIGWPENLGAFGDQAALVEFDAINKSRTQKLKGNRNAGSMALIFGIDYADSGQAALRAAEATDDSYAFRVEFDDMPSGGSTPSFRYFIAKVMTVSEQLDAANNPARLNSTLELDSNVVAVAAT